jgi:hypothetical protein
MLDSATHQQRNVIVRPRGPDVTFIQLDELKSRKAGAIIPSRVSHPQNLAGEFSGMARDPRSR